MATHLAHRIADHAPGERSTLVRAVTLLFGMSVFLGLIPWLLWRLGERVGGHFGALGAGRAGDVVGCAAIAGGLLLASWVARRQWFVGHGTPAPFVPTQTILTDGPFALCRNPMQLGAGLYYFGVCLVAGSWISAVTAWVVSMAIGSAYHRLVEEKELAMRFGAAYEEYRARTPFLFPRLR